MQKLLAVTFVFLVACMQTDNTNDMQITLNSKTGAVAQLVVGMTVGDLYKTYPQAVSRVEYFEGDPYEIIRVAISAQLYIDCVIYDGRLNQIKINSPVVHDEFGLSVGSTLTELKLRHSNGKLYIGTEAGPFASYSVGTIVMFVLDNDTIPESCFQVTKCELDPDEVVVREIRLSSSSED